MWVLLHALMSQRLEMRFLGLPNALLDEGIPNIWSEIGRNGLPEQSATKLQYEGVKRVLTKLGILDEAADPYLIPVLSGLKLVSVANQSEIWRSNVSQVTPSRSARNSAPLATSSAR